MPNKQEDAIKSRRRMEAPRRKARRKSIRPRLECVRGSGLDSGLSMLIGVLMENAGLGLCPATSKEYARGLAAVPSGRRRNDKKAWRGGQTITAGSWTAYSPRILPWRDVHFQRFGIRSCHSRIQGAWQWTRQESEATLHASAGKRTWRRNSWPSGLACPTRPSPNGKTEFPIVKDTFTPTAQNPRLQSLFAEN